MVDAAADVLIQGGEVAVGNAARQAELAHDGCDGRVVVVLDTREQVVLDLYIDHLWIVVRIGSSAKT